LETPCFQGIYLAIVDGEFAGELQAGLIYFWWNTLILRRRTTISTKPSIARRHHAQKP
jgi:hypothetical protein